MDNKKNLRFVILLGFVSLFADICYEGSRGIIGPYLASLGASATAVGFVAGAGELFGYGLRYISGRIADRSKQYWPLTIAGYCLTTVSVSLLAIAGHWMIACLLIILERAGKALRTPPRDVMLSFATQQMGRGYGFGIHKALDQIGALLGPLLVTLMLYLYGSYSLSFAVLFFPGIIAVGLLLKARNYLPRPQELEQVTPVIERGRLGRNYWIYVIALCFIGFGYADYPLIAYHFQKQGVVPLVWIPVYYGIAMGLNGISALILGRIFDYLGLWIIVFVTISSAMVAPLVFGSGFDTALMGVILWGLGMGAQESIIKAYVATMTSINERGTAYGMLNMCFGISWFFGSILLGMLYDYSISFVIIFSVTFQLLALIPLGFLLFSTKKRIHK